MDKVQYRSRKIAIVSHTLSGGGAERFSAVLGRMLDGLGYEIHHIVVNDAVDYAFAGTLFNLGKASAGQDILSRKIGKGRLLKRYLDDAQIDTVIDNRSRNIWLREWLTKRIYGDRKKIYVVHSFKIDDYFPPFRWLARWLYADADAIVGVSQRIADEIQSKYGLTNTQVIYNPVEVTPTDAQNQNPNPDKYLLFLGRFDDKVKNFGLMLEAFALSGVHQQGYRLLLMGNGPDESLLKDQIQRLQLQDSIQIVPFQSNPYTFLQSARFTLLTSRHEGFPMSLIESLALGVPVVSVDCPSGPSEIVQHEVNGLLVPNFDVAALSDAIKRLATDANLYDICKTNAMASVAHLSVESIGQQWQTMLEK